MKFIKSREDFVKLIIEVNNWTLDFVVLFIHYFANK